MGMYDIIILPEIIECNNCGSDIESFQTKAFGCFLIEYKIGDRISGTHYFNGVCVISDYIFCDNCHDTSMGIFMGIKDNILVSVDVDANKVYEDINKFDYEDLMKYYVCLGEENEKLEKKYKNLNAELHYFIDFLETLGPGESSRNYFNYEWSRSFLKEYLKEGSIIGVLKSIMKENHE